MARWRAAGTVAGLAGTAALLPGPASLIQQVSGDEPIAVLASGMVLAAAGVVWTLLAWALVVAVALAAAHLPGRAGRAARAAARCITPPSVRAALLVAAGITLIAGTSACAHPTGPGTASETVSTAAVTGVTGSPTALGAGTVTVSAGGAAAGTVTGSAAPTVTGSRAGTGPGASTMPAAQVADPLGAGPQAALGAVPDLDWPVQRSPATSGDGRPDGPADQAPDRPATPIPPPAPAAPTSAAGPGPTAAEVVPGRPAGPTAPAGRRPAGGALADHDPGPGRDGVGDAATEGPPGPSARTVTVRPGDSLWAIAARHLAPEASDAQVDAAWRAWYAANRVVIGDDPDLILPGQFLQAPDPEAIQP